MSLYIWFIMRASAWRTASSKPLASHSQASEAGAWQMAQSGSILMTPFPTVDRFLGYMASVCVSTRDGGEANIRSQVENTD